MRTPERGVSEALATQSVGVRGFACEAGVFGWRLETPTGLSGDGLPSKDNYVTFLFSHNLVINPVASSRYIIYRLVISAGEYNPGVIFESEDSSMGVP